MKTERIKLGNVIDTLKGYAFKSQWYLNQGIPIVKVSNFTDESIDNSQLDYVSEDIASEYQRYSLLEDDIIIQTVGSWPTNPKSVVGKVIRVPRNLKGALLNQNAVKIIPKNNVLIRFLFYSLKDNSFKDYIINCAQGAANQASITLDAIRAYDFDLPTIPSQRKIASILSAYDDLIENNTRRVKILEEMTQTIYKEWFVNFRFPGHEKVKFVDSSLGKIPEKWEVKRIGEVCKVGRGSSPRPISDKKYIEGGDIPWIKIADATASGKYLYETKEKINEYGASFSRIMEKGSLIVATSGTLGFCLFLGEKGCIHDGWLYMCDYKYASPSFLYFVINANREAFNNQSYGAAIQNINTDILRNTMFVLPEKELLKSFVHYIKSIDKEIDNLSRKNINLRKTRDLLLPKLMSGEVVV